MALLKVNFGGWRRDDHMVGLDVRAGIKGKIRNRMFALFGYNESNCNRKDE